MFAGLKMKNKKLLTFSLFFVALLVLCGALYFAFKEYKPKYDGTITVEVVNLDGTIKNSKKIKYTKDDSLVFLIESNFENVKMENGMIMSIMDYNTPSDWSSFLSIYVNDIESNVGLKDIKFNDKDVISLRIVEFIYNYES